MRSGPITILLWYGLMSKTRAEEQHLERVASVGCVVCRRLGRGYVACHVHHIAEGSSKRSHFAVVGLCPSHHTGAEGFHILGRNFLLIHKVPWQKEEGLLVWQNEDLAKYAS